MNAKKTLIVAVMTAFSAAGAFAGEANDFDQTWTRELPSVKTRAEVKAELAQARAQGEQLAVFSGEASVFPDAARTATAHRGEDKQLQGAVASGKTRAEVKAELAQARAEGPLPVFSGEASVFPEQGRSATARNSEDVKSVTVGR
ncbi:DUF4148 domain-containing protein [Aquabacterium sp. A7-Y]|uniref:DUF4148 domain-containing protein n=1 Tax=Aquabacterium sp. A7-Y TaxID=1349605 RepID=UPI00223CB84A|nr:DUF4148 domain-containing protein [Aquabacterium sp. A7-Y]MCW7536829.1 DUF4148 domain-containing protein [Aquabacterium sp. A7-Y]